jgi:hypothetical protein
MARRSSSTELGLVALTIEGGLIAPEQVQKVIAADRTPKTADSYACPKGTSLGDEIARFFRIGQAIWRDYDQADAKTIARTAAFARDLLTQCLGVTDLQGPVEHREGTRRYRIAWEGKGGRVPVVVAAPVEGSDAFAKSQPEFGDGEGGRPRRSPTALLQDWLNGTEHALWGLVFAGDRVRIMRDNASLTRPAWIEADFGAIFRDEMFADFTAFWLLAHATRFGAQDAAPSDCPLEQWREAGLKQGVEARKDLYANVETALTELGQGLADANPDLRERMQNEAGFTQSLFQEMLRTVYRLIFLAVAEDRDLLHPRRTPREARQLYAQGYSFTFWRERSRRKVARDSHHDAWEAMKVTLASLEHGEEMLGLPALGGLFAQSSTPHLNTATIPNRAFLAALFCLGFIRKDGITHRINWRDLKTEELGSVYEGLLEIRPSLTASGEFQLGTGAKGNDRKTSGSYYTPDSLVECLLDSALNPVLERAEASGATPEEKVAAILDLKVIDPACGSGHFLLGAARRMADRVARLRNEDAGKEDTQAALRDVVSRCIHGVDRNPMAVELAKVALWIESVSPGQPLGFLDANIRCGDALLGVFDLAVLEEGIPDEAYKPLTGDSKDAAKFYLKLNRDAKKGQGAFDFAGGGGVMPAKPIAAGLGRIKSMPEDTVGQVEKKRQAFEAWKADAARFSTEVACDLYMAAFLMPKTEVPLNYQRAMVPTTGDVRQRLAGGQIYGPLEGAATSVAKVARVLHWPLEFPDVLANRGGFDVVVGNPPWERIKLQEEEFFAVSAPEISDAKHAAVRKKMIAELWETNPELAAGWANAVHRAAAESGFIRLSGRFPLGGVGDVNTYAVFADHFRQLVSKTGRAGMIIPNGLVTGFTYRSFLRHMLSTKTLASFFGFENEEKLFPSVHNETKFGILTITGGSEDIDQPWFTAHLRQPSQIDDPERRYALSIKEIEAINPNTLNLPAFRWARDAKVAAAIHRASPVLVQKADGEVTSPWDVSFAALFHMAGDSGLFIDNHEVEPAIVSQDLLRARLDDGRELYPLYEGKMFWHFDHRYGTYKGQTEKQANKGVLPRTGEAEHDDPRFRIQTQYWIEAHLLDSALGERRDDPFFFSWRDVGPSERTFVGTVLPKTAAGDAAPIMFTSKTGPARAALYALLSSLLVDYAARQKSKRMKHFVVEQLPIQPPSVLAAECQWLGDTWENWLSARVFELCYTSEDLRPFANDLGRDHPPFRWAPERRPRLQAEIDAAVIHLYNLTRDQAEWLLDSFAVLRKYEERDLGEFRTKELVLEAYDAMQVAKFRGRVFQSLLVPPPADEGQCHAR